MSPFLKIESSDSDTFCDMLHHQFHSTISHLIASTVGLGKLNIPTELYKEYQKCIAEEIKIYRETTLLSIKKKSANTVQNDHVEPLKVIRSKTDSCYERIRELIYASFLLGNNSDESEDIEFLICKLNHITVQTKMFQYQRAIDLKE